MTMDLGRVGLWAGFRLPHGAEFAAAATVAEELGYGALWLGGGPAPSPRLEWPAEVLAGTSRIPVASAIASVWSAPGADLAARYHELEAAHPGRFLLGLGVSHEGIAEAYRRPYQKLVSYLDELDAAEPPVPAGRRAVAALGPRMLALSGERTAGTFPYLVTPEHTAQARQVLGAGPMLAPMQMAVPDTDPASARRTARARLAMYLSLPNYLRNFERVGFTAEDFADGGSDRLVDAMVVHGDPDTIRARVDEHLAAGATHVAVQVLTAEENAIPVQDWRDLAPALLG